MRYFFGVCSLLVLLLVGSCALAAGVPPASPAEFGNVSAATVSAINEPAAAHWFWSVLASSVVASVLAALGKFIQSIIAGIKDARVARACEFIYAGTMACYHEYVRVAKAKSGDGKLTIDEKDEAMQYAYRKAIEIAKAQGFDLLKVFAKETILALIERYVGQSKANVVIQAVRGPLADLSPSAPSV